MKLLKLAVCAGLGVWFLGCADLPVRKPSPYVDSPLREEAKTCVAVSDPELAEFYRTFQPRRGFYLFKLFRTPNAASVTLYIVRAIEYVPDGGASSIQLPAVEKIIGPISTERDWHLVFAFLRRYASSPPAGNYCWMDDCYGRYNVRTDGTGEFPPIPGQDPPRVPPVGGYAVVQTTVGGGQLRDPAEDVVRYALRGGDSERLRLLATPEVVGPAMGAASNPSCVDGRGDEVKDQAARVLRELGVGGAQGR